MTGAPVEAGGVKDYPGHVLPCAACIKPWFLAHLSSPTFTHPLPYNMSSKDWAFPSNISDLNDYLRIEADAWNEDSVLTVEAVSL
jgi:hypothetical protein